MIRENWFEVGIYGKKKRANGTDSRRATVRTMKTRLEWEEERERKGKIEYRLIACSCLFRASVYPVDFPVTVV